MLWLYGGNSGLSLPPLRLRPAAGHGNRICPAHGNDPRGEISGWPGAGAGRLRHHLCRLGYRAGTEGRHQGILPFRSGQPESRLPGTDVVHQCAVPAGETERHADIPERSAKNVQSGRYSQRGTGAGSFSGKRDSLHRHGLCGRRDAESAAGKDRPADMGAGEKHFPSRHSGHGAGASGWPCPPGYQPGQPDADAGRQGKDSGFGRGEGLERQQWRVLHAGRQGRLQPL